MRQERGRIFYVGKTGVPVRTDQLLNWWLEILRKKLGFKDHLTNINYFYPVNWALFVISSLKVRNEGQQRNVPIVTPLVRSDTTT